MGNPMICLHCSSAEFFRNEATIGEDAVPCMVSKFQKEAYLCNLNKFRYTFLKTTSPPFGPRECSFITSLSFIRSSMFTAQSYLYILWKNQKKQKISHVSQQIFICKGYGKESFAGSRLITATFLHANNYLVTTEII